MNYPYIYFSVVNSYFLKRKDVEQEDSLTIIRTHHGIACINLPEFSGKYLRL